MYYIWRNWLNNVFICLFYSQTSVLLNWKTWLIYEFVYIFRYSLASVFNSPPATSHQPPAGGRSKKEQTIHKYKFGLYRSKYYLSFLIEYTYCDIFNRILLYCKYFILWLLIELIYGNMMVVIDVLCEEIDSIIYLLSINL